MKFEPSEEWYHKMAAIEADYDVCAGRQIFPMSKVPEPTPAVKPKKTRKPKASKPVAHARTMKFERSEEWYHKMAAIEADYDVCAGRQIFPRTVVSEPTPTAKPKKPRKQKASKPVAQTRTSRRRSTATKSSGS